SLATVTSARRTHLRSVSDVQPTFSATEQIAAHCEPCCPSVSHTSRTARSRVSREYFDRFAMTQSSQPIRSPANSGRFNLPLRVDQVGQPGLQPLPSGLSVALNPLLANTENGCDLRHRQLIDPAEPSDHAGLV